MAKTKKKVAPKVLLCDECELPIEDVGFVLGDGDAGGLLNLHPHCWIIGDDVEAGLEWIINLTAYTLEHLHERFSKEFVLEYAEALSDCAAECLPAVIAQVKRLREMAQSPEAQNIAWMNSDPLPGLCHSQCVGCVSEKGAGEQSAITPGEAYIIGSDDRGDGGFHLACWLQGECFADLTDNVHTALKAVGDTLQTFRREYPESDLPELAYAWRDDLSHDYGALQYEFDQIDVLSTQFALKTEAARKVAS